MRQILSTSRSLQTLQALLPSTLALGLLAGAAGAQYALEPPPGMAKFDRMIGEWDGEGIYYMAPETEGMPWTAQASVRKALNGFAVIDDSLIQTAFGTMPWRTYYAWDQMGDKPVMFGLGETIEDAHYELYWVDDDTLVGHSIGRRMGVPTSTTWTTHYEADSFHFTIDMTMGDQPSFRQLEGRYHRVDREEPVQNSNVTSGMAPVAPEMERLGGMVGTHAMTGTARMAPEMPAMPMPGEDTGEAIFGGGVMATRFVAPMPEGMPAYEGHGFYWWNSERECYMQAWISNMGDASVAEARFVGNDLISVGTGHMQGVPFSNRMTLSFDEEGTPLRLSADTLKGNHESIRSLQLEYAISE